MTRRFTGARRAVKHLHQKHHEPFSIFTATVSGLLGFSLSMPTASAMTTWPKQPSPRGLPRVSLKQKHRLNQTVSAASQCCSSAFLTVYEETPIWGQVAVPAQRRWRAWARHSTTGGRFSPAACWSSWKSWNPRTPAWVQKENCCRFGKKAP